MWADLSFSGCSKPPATSVPAQGEGLVGERPPSLGDACFQPSWNLVLSCAASCPPPPAHTHRHRESSPFITSLQPQGKFPRSLNLLSPCSRALSSGRLSSHLPEMLGLCVRPSRGEVRPSEEGSCWRDPLGRHIHPCLQAKPPQALPPSPVPPIRTGACGRGQCVF